MLTHLLLLAVSLAALTAGAELLIRGAASLARRLGMSSFFIGLTIVGFGTSTPELATSISAGLNNLADICLGNVVGSNIFNIACILGIAALIAPIPVNTRAVRTQSAIMIATGFLPYLALFTGGVITRGLGLLMVAGLFAFLYYGYRSDRPDDATPDLAAAPGMAPSSTWDRLFLGLAGIAGGLTLLIIGARVLVSSAVEIARAAGISDLVIGLTVVAAGTSLPELFTSVVAAFRRQADISIGNLVGSNIFNILGIAGITASLYPQNVNRQLLLFDMPLMIVVCIATVPIMFSGHRVSRFEGALLLGVFVAYLTLLLTVVPAWFAG